MIWMQASASQFREGSSVYLPIRICKQLMGNSILSSLQECHKKPESGIEGAEEATSSRITFHLLDQGHHLEISWKGLANPHADLHD